MNIFNRKKNQRFFKPEEEQMIVLAIKEAEGQTSGEIKVHIESRCEGHPFERGLEVFTHLEMQLTRQRNGVLFYLAMKDHRFAIVADEGINAVVEETFWDDIKEEMQAYFIAGNIVEGLKKGVLMAGQQLKIHLPYSERDKNEISDDISMGD